MASDIFAFYASHSPMTEPGAELRRRHDGDDGLCVPPTVFNALGGRPEAINRTTHS